MRHRSAVKPQTSPPRGTRSGEYGRLELFEDGVGHSGLEIPIDQSDRRQVERGVRNHQHPDATCDSEDGTICKPDDRGLFDAREPWREKCASPNDAAVTSTVKGLAHAPDPKSFPKRSNRYPRKTVSSPNPARTIIAYSERGSAP